MHVECLAQSRAGSKQPRNDDVIVLVVAVVYRDGCSWTRASPVLSPVTAVSLGAALARHTVGTQCVGLSLSSLHHTAELTEASSFTKVTCALQVKSPQSGCLCFCGVSAWPRCQSPEFPSS